MTILFMKKQCDGLCSMDNKCKGTVKEVIVSGFDDDSGKVQRWNYCAEARRYDERGGLTVEVINESV